MDAKDSEKSKPSVRRRADAIKDFRCKNLIAILECPTDVKNIGTVIRNANALGVEKVYVVDPRHSLPDDWQELRDHKSVSKTSVSASKWTFVKRFNSTDECFDYLEDKNFISIVTSPHVKGKKASFFTRVITPPIISSRFGSAVKQWASATARWSGVICASPSRCSE